MNSYALILIEEKLSKTCELGIVQRRGRQQDMFCVKNKHVLCTELLYTSCEIILLRKMKYILGSWFYIVMYASNYILVQQSARGILPPNLFKKITYKLHVCNSYLTDNFLIVGKKSDDPFNLLETLVDGSSGGFKWRSFTL
jgi:hypothetical protein